MFLFILASSLLIFIDLFVKRMAVQYLAYGKEVLLIPDVLRLIYVENYGAAFGLFQKVPLLIITVAILVSIYILYYIDKEKCKSRLQYAGMIFLFAGAVGNLVNRVLLGYVIDYIDFPYWPTFNLADIFINIGIILIIVFILRDKKQEI